MSDRPIMPEKDGAQCAQPLLCRLNEVAAGASVRIKQLTATPEISLRLRELGFCEEQRIKLLLKPTNANVVCQVCNVRLGISTKLAESIIVETIAPARKKAA